MKIDMHCHSYYSRDGISSPESLLIKAKKIGLDGVALTDHNNTRGWARAQKIADELGLILIPGEELKIKENNETIGEILAYFITEEIDPKGKTAKEVIDEIKKQNGIAIIAHPYQWKKPFKKLEECKNLVDGVEIFNSRSQSKKGNEMSLAFAKRNNLPMTAGSDSHTTFEIGRSYIETDATNIEELKNSIKNNDIQIEGRQTNPAIQIFAGLAKLINLFYKPI
jgi:hypothetical protein